jgi:hypothetical protein
MLPVTNTTATANALLAIPRRSTVTTSDETPNTLTCCFIQTLIAADLCKSTSQIALPMVPSPSLRSSARINPFSTVSLSITPLFPRTLIISFTIPVVNSGCPCSVRIRIGGIEPSTSGIRASKSENCTIPWFLDTLVDPSRWNDGGTEGTWSRCICWMFYHSISQRA